jgi:2-iminobutanoate/2-iminopropanoate deaminase
MKATPITTEDDRHPAVAISMGFRVGDLLFISGQVATDTTGAIVGEDLETQAHKVFEKLARALAAGGSSLEDVIKVTIFVTELAGHFDTIVALRRRYFTEPYPADTLVEVSALARPGLLIEIEAIATVREEEG